MLSFFISTIAFFVAVFFINRYLDEQGLDSRFSRKLLVGMLATLVAIGVGWVVDKLDGDADAPAAGLSLDAALQGQDPAQTLKALSGNK